MEASLYSIQGQVNIVFPSFLEAIEGGYLAKGSLRVSDM